MVGLRLQPELPSESGINVHKHWYVESFCSMVFEMFPFDVNAALRSSTVEKISVYTY